MCRHVCIKQTSRTRWRYLFESSTLQSNNNNNNVKKKISGSESRVVEGLSYLVLFCGAHGDQGALIKSR